MPPLPRPAPSQEALGSFLLYTLAPRLGPTPATVVPPELEPVEEHRITRRRGPGHLAAGWFAPPGEPRGVVMMVHPWLAFARSYFYRRGRVEALRAAGYGALLVDLPGFGASAPRRGFPDLDLEDTLEHAAELAAGLPVHVWGVSSGGYWLHPVLVRRRLASSAFFEDVAPHLLEWSGHNRPWARPFHHLFRTLAPASHRFLDLRRHAPHLQVNAVTYVSGAEDVGVPAADTRSLAASAPGGSCWIVPDAGHLAAIKLATAEVHARALATFARGEEPASASRG